jgi:hypothetical protein
MLSRFQSAITAAGDIVPLLQVTSGGRTEMVKLASVVVALVLLSARAASAQQVGDLQEMAKWASAQLVHFHIEGQHQSALTPTLESASVAVTDVTDRLIMDFDYWLLENRPEGTVKFQNFKSTTKTGPNGEAGCALLKGEFEFLDAKEITVEPGQVKVKGTRSFPAADVAFQCPDSMTRTPVAPKQVPVEEHFTIEHPVKLLLGGANSSDIKVAPDKKSYTLQMGGPNAWNWTFTPTVLK